MKEIKYIILYLVPVPQVKKLRFRFHNAARQKTVLAPEVEAALLPFGPIEGHLYWFFQLSSQWEFQKNRSAFISFGKVQFWPPCIWDHLFSSCRLCTVPMLRTRSLPYFFLSINSRGRFWMGLVFFCHKHHELVLLPKWMLIKEHTHSTDRS
jgi:hypothetical protein